MDTVKRRSAAAEGSAAGPGGFATSVNLGISIGPDGMLRAQNRGQYLIPPYTGQFEALGAWLAAREDALFDALGESLILFGEWCAARYSIAYESLPDWLLVFDVYDRAADRFWSTGRRDALAATLGLPAVPRLTRGPVSLAELKSLVASSPSRFRDGPLEGVVLRLESDAWLAARAKLVRADFAQAIGEHWSQRGIDWNRRAAAHQAAACG